MLIRKFHLYIGFAILVISFAPTSPFTSINPIAQADRSTPIGRIDNSVNAEFSGITGPLRDMKPDSSESSIGIPGEVYTLPELQSQTDDSLGKRAIDTPLQTKFPQAPNAVSIIKNFPGTSRVENILTPDPSLDVGPNHVISLVNQHYQIFDREGTTLVGPNATNTLWSSGQCATQNDGQGVVLYDQLAHKW
jgi:hypothetical protein